MHKTKADANINTFMPKQHSIMERTARKTITLFPKSCPSTDWEPYFKPDVCLTRGPWTHLVAENVLGLGLHHTLPLPPQFLYYLFDINCLLRS